MFDEVDHGVTHQRHLQEPKLKSLPIYCRFYMIPHMPCDCVLDLNRRLVKAWAWGTVTHAEAMANRLKFSTHPDFKPDFNQIYDTLAVTGIAVNTIEIGLLARDHVFGLGSRRAFIGPRTDTFGFLRTFQLYRQINGGKEQIRLFPTAEAAEAWLAT